MPRAGYDSDVVQRFLTHRGLRRADGKLIVLNDERLTESNREMVARWAQIHVVDLGKVDGLLVKYDIRLHELDDWATETFGWNGYIEPLQ